MGGREIDVRQLEGGGGREIDVRQLEGGGGREIDVRQLEGGRQGDRCEATGALWVAKVWEWMCVSSGFWLLYTLRTSFTPYPCEALYTPKVLSAKLRKNLETYEL